jgi:hypothetical protein
MSLNGKRKLDELTPADELTTGIQEELAPPPMPAGFTVSVCSGVVSAAEAATASSIFISQLAYSESFTKINYSTGDALLPLLKDIKNVDDLTLESIAIFAMLKESRNVQRPGNINTIINSDPEDVVNMKTALKRAIHILDNDNTEVSVYNVLKPFAETKDGQRVRPKGCGVVTSMFILSMLRPDLIAFCCEPQRVAAAQLKDSPQKLKDTFRFNALQCSQFDSFVRGLQENKNNSGLNLLQISNALWYCHTQKVCCNFA